MSPNIERAYFKKIRDKLCLSDDNIQMGKMMNSEAIIYKKKVFTFLSKKNKMVFKLGKQYDPTTKTFDIQVFNPFKKRKPLNGWFEVPYSEKEKWKNLAEHALNLLKSEL